MPPEPHALYDTQRNQPKKRLFERAYHVSQVRTFFEQRGFLEVDTPLLVPSPGLDVHLDAFEVVLAPSEHVRFLITSPEYQMKRLLADGYSRIFQICKCFRKNEFGQRHNPEFTMLEWYRSNAGMIDVMADTELLVSRVTGGSVRLDDVLIDTSPPFQRLSVCEAFEQHAGLAPEQTLRLAETNEELFYRLLVDKVEPALALLPHAVFLTDYPAPQASLARKQKDNPRLAERFELYVGGVELCNGFGELTCAREQRQRLERDQQARLKLGLPAYPIDERFLAALERGMPPSGGNALGLDRLIALACGTRNMSEVLAFNALEV